MKTFIGILIIVLGALVSTSAVIQLYTYKTGGEFWMWILRILPVDNVKMTTLEYATYIISLVLVILGTYLIVKDRKSRETIQPRP